MTQHSKRMFSFFVPVVALAFISRFVPHIPNITPLGALGIVSSRQMSFYKSIALVLSTLFVSDILIGFYHPLVVVSVYGSFALYGVFGKISENNIASLVYAGVGGAVSFFLITNFAVWLSSDWYPKTAQGLMSAYALGLPFFRNMLIGDICFTALLGYIYEVFTKTRQLPAPMMRSWAFNAEKYHA